MVKTLNFRIQTWHKNIHNCSNSVYRASNLGVAHEAELLGFNEPVYINNLLPAGAAVAHSEPVLSLPQPVVVRTPSEVFGAQAPALELPVT